MEKTQKMYPDMSREDREKMMASQCYKVITEDFSRTLSDDDLDAEKSGYTQNAISLEGLKGELKEITARYKGQIKGIETVMVEALKVISSGKRKVNGKLFLFPDHQSGRMRFFDVWGELIQTRPLTIDEKQTKLFLGDDGTNKHAEGNDGQIFDVEHVEITDEQPADPPTETTDAPKSEKRKANRKKLTPGEDINGKVAAMSAAQKGRKAAFQKAVENNDNADAGDHTDGVIIGDGAQTMEIHIDEAPINQIPREETKIDPSQVPDLDPDEDDNLPE